ncbi:LacI family DNA-binding transcriptional regulator [Paenibacillus sedimenti]|uniref:LacI family DNA-binding transcriptional regulator n=1 Tax=Paenibacillus sedimenti TaxID=2770274 RepID=A0A926KMW2_9BACL|nr:LacI family DNA-binding transcriptional regulator [Paenibacillus sedimenti]MBD0379906.1 LacI family DNA-binding transcriptional regulator [Paenibacillus sedimenti]
MPTRKRVTMKTIAKELGLTIQTVSKALKGKPGMSEATRQQIVQTAEKLGYYTMDQIRSLRLDRIAPYPNERLRFLLVQTAESVAYNRLFLQGLQDRFITFGHRIELLMLPRTIKEAHMRDWIEESGMAYADGVFIAPSIMPKAWEPALFELKVPRILLSFPPPCVKIDSVIWDVYEATFQSVAYLRSLGHERIMYVGDTHAQRGFILRWQAFCHAMSLHGIEIDPAMHSIHERSGLSQWREELKEQMRQYAPSAIICGIDHEVSAVYDLCGELGWRVPEDVSVVGFLNEQSEALPLFTRPLLPIRETGYRAADRMLWRIANPTLPFEHIRIQGDFFVGGTTALAGS